MTKADYFLTKAPLTKESECGDTGFIKEFDNKGFMAVADVLGHSSEAHVVATRIDEILQTNYREDLPKLMDIIHHDIESTRGAAVSICLLDLCSYELKCVGIGNITTRTFGSITVRLIPKGGIVGYVMPSPVELIVRLRAGDVVASYSDGVQEHFDINDYPDILSHDAETISENIMRKFSKGNDDAICAVLKIQGTKQ